MIRIEVRAGTARAYLNNLHTKQVPFATARALNSVYNDAQNALRAEIQRRFVLRQPQYVLRTIYRDRRDMADHRAKRFEATVRLHPQSGRHPNAGLLARFIEGNPKTRGAFPVFIPTSVIRPGFQQQVPRYLYPKPLGLDQTYRYSVAPGSVGKAKRKRGSAAARLVKPFILSPETHGVPLKAWGIYRRWGPGKRDIEMIWSLKNMIQIPKRLEFYGIGNRVVRQQWPVRFAQAMEAALATARGSIGPKQASGRF